MASVKQPDHEHSCLICKGKYPCWNTSCTLQPYIICDDCTEEKEEEAINQGSKEVC